jgi:hypothetical protein
MNQPLRIVNAIPLKEITKKSHLQYVHVKWEIRLSLKKCVRKDTGRSRQQIFWTHHAKEEHYCNEAKIQLRLEKADRRFQHPFISNTTTSEKPATFVFMAEMCRMRNCLVYTGTLQTGGHSDPRETEKKLSPVQADRPLAFLTTCLYKPTDSSSYTMQNVPSKHWYLPTRLQAVITLKTTLWTITTVKTKT